MQEQASILLVYEKSFALDFLRATLQKHSQRASQVRSCAEARQVMKEVKPHVVFTDDRLPDGTWADVADFAVNIDTPPNVVVIKALADGKFLIRNVKQVIYDFVLPPFESDMLDQIVNSALRQASNGKGSKEFVDSPSSRMKPSEGSFGEASG